MEEGKKPAAANKRGPAPGSMDPKKKTCIQTGILGNPMVPHFSQHMIEEQDI
jgi:hypothetical protein